MARALAAAAPPDDPRQWLARTDEALSKRNYEGVFVHEHAGESETLRVIHRVDGEGIAERLQSMDGSGREFIRKGSQLICYLPDQHTVLVERSPDAALLLSGLPRMEAGSAGQYDIKELARTRVSGRDARVIAIAPLDQLRYGYRVWVDEGTAMPLKTQLRDSHDSVLEQIVFTSLNMLSRVSSADLEPGVDARNYRWIRRDAEPVDADALSVSWESAALPAGFRMTASARQVLPAGPVEHLVFSDGLASVSVFVEVGHDNGAGGAGTVREDAAALGASSAFSTVVQGYRVTAVGEVPPETVRVIAQAIRNAVPAPVVSDVNPEAAGAAAAPPSSLVFLPGARSGFDAPASNALAPAAAPISHSLGADRPVFGPTFPAAPPALPAGGGPGRR
ncbi:MAG TPA: MucB/RseB C-terminal domain-containing protein [Steroidobacteraceae bacterium]